MTPHEKAAVDTFIAAGAVTAPWWATDLGVWLNIIAAAGSVLLVAIRLCIAVRDLRQGRHHG